MFNVNSIYLTITPLLIFMLGGILCLLFYKRVNIQRAVVLISTVIALISGVKLVEVLAREEFLTMQVGGWEAPFGITLFVDRFAGLMIAMTALLAVSASLFSFSDSVMPTRKKQIGFYPAFMFMLAGISGAFLTGDLFNLYVWFEVMLISSFVLITLGSKKDQLQGGIKYVIINFIASSFLLLAIGILYGTTGNTNLAALAESLRDPALQTVTQLAAVLLLASFGIKAALFPFYFWLPASYHTSPIAVMAIVAGLLTKVGVYTMIRTFTLLFPLQQYHYLQVFILIISSLTMLMGVFGAIAQRDIRKVLAYNLISKIGFIVYGLAVYTPAAVAGAIFYTLHHMLVKTNLFFVVGIIGKARGSYRVKDINGLYDHFPRLSFLFFVLALTLVGIPPFSGFWGKFMLVDAGLSVYDYRSVALLLIVSLLTLYSMMRIWGKCFLTKFDTRLEQLITERVFMKEYYQVYIASVFLFLVTLWISFSPSWLIEYTQRAAEQVLTPSGYINAVMQR